MRLAQRLIFLLILSSTLSACVVPPSDVQPSVIDRGEIDLVTHLQDGKQYAEIGRLDLAEREFRQALQLSKNYASIYNNLGYVLSGQQRYREASHVYERALAIAPRDLASRENAARALFKLGDIQGALREYELILNMHRDQLLQIAGEPTRKILNQGELASVYRNASLALYTLGILDESVCHSAMATAFEPTEQQVGQHARMLLSIERISEAFIILRDAILGNRGNVSPDIMFDYAVSLATIGDNLKSKQALERMLAIPGLQKAERREAKVLLAVLATRENKRTLAQRLFDEVREIDDQTCAQPDLIVDDYWPFKVVVEASELLSKYCEVS